MSKPVTVVDNLIFGKSPNYNLPIHNQHNWITQIEAPGTATFDEYVALTHAAALLKRTVKEVFTNDLPEGDKRNKLIVNYHEMLTTALTELNDSNPADKGIFDSYLNYAIREVLPGLDSPEVKYADTCFMLNMYGNVNRHFPALTEQQGYVTKIVNALSGKEGLTVETTVLAAAITARDCATALRDGVIAIEEGHRDWLVETAQMFVALGDKAGFKDAASALGKAISELEAAPVLERSAPAF